MGADDESGPMPVDTPRPDGDGADATEGDDDTAHLDDLPDGSGCAEVWEYVSEERDDDTETDAEGDDREGDETESNDAEGDDTDGDR
ncbi:hypothetical protein [Haloglomus litoreum]|uniref:hypothetical protein n=1 Tax=Haloglomus litoreum TaxID=3034026 RepID=UPI0023E8031F|nr:hypothetical protein [Haloglomus sp. DT116]